MTIRPTCYDREYLFQWSEMDPRIHSQAEAQVKATGVNTALSSGATGNGGTCPSTALASRGCLMVFTEPYHPAYYTINGRSMPPTTWIRTTRPITRPSRTTATPTCIRWSRPCSA